MLLVLFNDKVMASESEVQVQTQGKTASVKPLKTEE